jgi:hypothetical protein
LTPSSFPCGHLVPSPLAPSSPLSAMLFLSPAGATIPRSVESTRRRERGVRRRDAHDSGLMEGRRSINGEFRRRKAKWLGRAKQRWRFQASAVGSPAVGRRICISSVGYVNLHIGWRNLVHDQKNFRYWYPYRSSTGAHVLTVFRYSGSF